MKGKLLVGGLASLTLVVSMSTAAFAHDCFIINRSDRSSQQAGTHSTVWVAFSLHDDVLAAPFDPTSDESGFGCTTPAADAITAAVKAAGLPIVLATRSDKVIGDKSSNPNLGNGKGLEHFGQSTYFNDVVNFALAYEQAHPGSCAAFA